MDKKNRLTITLNSSVLRQLDERIDGSRIRNRSHAIEYVLTKHFAPKVRKAVILAGGQGVKMRPVTYEMPKGLIPVNGRPVLEHIIDNLRRYDIRELILSVGHHGEKIKKHRPKAWQDQNCKDIERSGLQNLSFNHHPHPLHP